VETTRLPTTFEILLAINKCRSSLTNSNSLRRVARVKNVADFKCVDDRAEQSFVRKSRKTIVIFASPTTETATRSRHGRSLTVVIFAPFIPEWRRENKVSIGTRSSGRKHNNIVARNLATLILPICVCVCVCVCTLECIA